MADVAGERFGRLAVEAGSSAELLELERAHGLAEALRALDHLIGEIAVRLLRGETPFSLQGKDDTGARRRTATLRLSGPSEEQRRLLDENFSLNRQQTRGSWSLPEKTTARLGPLHFPTHLGAAGKFFHNAVESDSYASVSPGASPEAVLAHAVLNPLLLSFYEPFALRSGRALPANRRDSREKSREERKRRWRAAEDFFAAVGFDVEDRLSVLRPGGGWTRLRAAEQLAAKVALGDAIQSEAARVGPLALGSRYRAVRLKPMLERYYAKADRRGRALRQRVLTRELEVTLTAFFGGDWLAFLDYVGEEPHPEEHVATALPEPRMYLGLSKKAPADLGVEGVSEEQLELIAASLYGGKSSPAQERISLLKWYWKAFDEVHARQRSGMAPLWGLVEEWRRFSPDRAPEPDGPYSEGIYRRLLPSELLGKVEELWGTAMSPREPGRIVTEPFPHALMAEAFGPALRFWQGCALTAWFLCEGPSSRTDMEGLEHYHRRELAELEDLGTPVDRGMFAELVAAEKRLGPPEPTHVEERETEIEPGITFTSTISRGSRRKGFEAMREVVTEHRRRWAERYLDAYFGTRAEVDVREAAKHYHKKMAERGGKPPTAKQFAKVALEPTNRWFGGDVAALYRAFGERAPVSPEQVRCVPADPEVFVRRVYSVLGGVEVGSYPDDYTKYEEHGRKVRENHNKAELANMALDYLRLEEALGTPPTLQKLGKARFANRSEGVMGDEVEAAWDQFVGIIRDVLGSRAETSSAGLDTASPMNGRNELKPQTDGRTRTDDGAWFVDNPRNPLVPVESKYAPSEVDEQVEESKQRRKPWWRRLLGG